MMALTPQDIKDLKESGYEARIGDNLLPSGEMTLLKCRSRRRAEKQLEQLPLFPELQPTTARTRRKGPATSRGAEDAVRLSGRMGRGMYQALELANECQPATIKEMAAIAALPLNARWSHFYRMDLQELRRRVSDCKLEKLLAAVGQRTGPRDSRKAEVYELTGYGGRVLVACRQKFIAQNRP